MPKVSFLAFALMLVVPVGHLCAHDPDASWAIVRVVDGTLDVEVEMACEAAQALLGVEMGTAPAPEDPSTLVAPLSAVAGEVYQFTLLGVPLVMRSATVQLDEEDGVSFHLVFVLPPDGRGPLGVDARYLEKVTPVHRAAISFVDARGGVIAGRRLTPDKRLCELPPPGA